MRKFLALGIIVVVVLLGATTLLVHAHRNTSVSSTQSSTGTPASTNKPTTTPTPTPGFDKTRYSTTDPNSIWVVVNKQHPLSPINYAPPDLTAVGNGQYMRAEAATALKSMLAGATTAGYTVTAASAYRSYPTQVSVYANEVKSYGQATADSESARPGFSEHQTGLAVDLASGSCSITDCFGTTPGGQWITANAYKYGFLLRYTAANTATTGYRAETWHFRYIGIDLATELHNTGVTTLEQFFGITGGPNY
jgi:D-alanyl-D-alanine carboxypeptidase